MQRNSQRSLLSDVAEIIPVAVNKYHENLAIQHASFFTDHVVTTPLLSTIINKTVVNVFLLGKPFPKMVAYFTKFKI